MAHDYEYFAEFLNDPTIYSRREFEEKLGGWADYIRQHAGEFNYAEDEEWREIRERLIDEYWRREEIREEFGVLEAELEANDLIEDNPERVEILRRWLSFTKTYQHIYEFTDESLADFETDIESFAQSVENTKISRENLRLARLNEEKAIERLDEAMGEHYERTGKRPVLTAIPNIKKHKGN